MSIATEPGPAQLRQHSYAVVRGLFDAATTQRLRQISERVLEQWLVEAGEPYPFFGE